MHNQTRRIPGYAAETTMAGFAKYPDFSDKMGISLRQPITG